jgi:hypothetical protein
MQSGIGLDQLLIDRTKVLLDLDAHGIPQADECRPFWDPLLQH